MTPSVPDQAERLDSWKQIAAYLKRDIRTVQRWEKLEGLPVHRHQHQKRGSAFAYAEELDAWWSGRGKELEAVEVVSPPVSTPAAAAWSAWSPRATTGLRWVLLLGIAAASSLVMFARIGAVHEHPLQRLQATAPTDTRISVHPVISPDGKRIVFVGSDSMGISHLWLRPMDALDSQLLPGTEGAGWPFWSADGRSLAFFAGGKLKRTEPGAQGSRGTASLRKRSDSGTLIRSPY